MSIVLVIILIAVILVVYFYNGLVTLNNKVKDAWIDLETYLKKRYDTIPVLIETLKVSQLIDTSSLVNLRSKAMQATSLTDKAEAEKDISEAINKILAEAENVQELKTNQNYIDLAKAFKETEDQIQTSRRFYNGAVRDFNLRLLTPPNNLIASKLGFNKTELFATKEELASEPTPEPATATTITPQQEPASTQTPPVTHQPEPAPQPTPVTTVEPQPEPMPEPVPLTPEPASTPEPAQPSEPETETPQTTAPEMTPKPESTPETETVTPEPVQAPETPQEPETVQPQETVQAPESTPEKPEEN